MIRQLMLHIREKDVELKKANQTLLSSKVTIDVSIDGRVHNTYYERSRSIIVPRGRSRGGRTRRVAPPPLKLEKIWFFGVKSWFFTRNTPQIFAPPSAIGKNTIFWRKIVIFHTKYPKNFSASLRSAQFFLSTPPLTWNPGSAPGTCLKISFNHCTCLKISFNHCPCLKTLFSRCAGQMENICHQ